MQTGQAAPAGGRAAAGALAPREWLLLGLLVFAVGLRFAYQLVVQPGDLYSIRQLGAE